MAIKGSGECRKRSLRIRLSSHLSVWSYLRYLYSGCMLYFFHDFYILCWKSLTGTTDHKLSFFVLWFKSYRPCRERALYFSSGVVGWCKGVMYLVSPGRPTDIGLQLGKACFVVGILCHLGIQMILAYSWARPAILIVGKGRGGMFLFLLFLPFHSCFSFFPVPLFHLFYYLFYLFSPFFWEATQNDPQGLMCH